MARTTAWLGWVVMLVVTCGVETASAEGQPLRMHIRFSQHVEVPKWVLARARDVIAHVYARAAIDVIWAPEPDGDTTDLQLTVILTADAPVNSTAQKDVLAVAIGAESGCGRLAYVVWPRVAAFAHARRVQAPNVLGRVIAHEVGHLLLGHNAHQGDGIMRAQWNRADFASIDNHAVFSSEQSARMREQITMCHGVALTK